MLFRTKRVTRVFPILEINGVAELVRWEPTILARIRTIPGGTVLYVMHPLLLLEDIGVRLAPDLVEMLRERYPNLDRRDEQHYQRFRERAAEEGIKIQVKHLFGEDLVAS